MIIHDLSCRCGSTTCRTSTRAEGVVRRTLVPMAAQQWLDGIVILFFSTTWCTLNLGDFSIVEVLDFVGVSLKKRLEMHRQLRLIECSLIGITKNFGSAVITRHNHISPVLRSIEYIIVSIFIGNLSTAGCLESHLGIFGCHALFNHELTGNLLSLLTGNRGSAGQHRNRNQQSG